MKCHRCQTELTHWRTHCPQCRAHLMPLPHTTISEEEAGKRRQRARMIKWLRVGLLTALLLALAVAAKMNSAKTSHRPLPSTQVAQGEATATSSPKPADDRTINAPPALPQPERRVRQALSAVPAVAPTVAWSQTTPPKAIPTPGPSPAPRIASADPALVPAAPQNVTPPALPRAAAAPAAPAAVAEQGSIEVDLADVALSARTALLTIKSYAPARIYIDGAYSGVTPRTVKLLAGEHTVMLIADGYQEWTRKVRLNGQEQAGILASLRKFGADAAR